MAKTKDFVKLVEKPLIAKLPISYIISTRVKKNSNARVEREKNEKGRKHSELEWNRKKVQNISWNRWDLQKKKIFWFTNVDQT